MFAPKSLLSILRKIILLGWAFAVIWIYLGNLVNFHQHRIWGKQLIPVAYTTTRAKEKDAHSCLKNDGNKSQVVTGLHFDFTTPNSEVAEAIQPVSFFCFNLSGTGTISISCPDTHFLRGPPTV